MSVYRSVLRPLLFLLDGEQAHRVGMMAASACNAEVIGRLVNNYLGYSHECLGVEVAGIRFAAPLGIAAGFDKEGEAVAFAQSIGASHIEVGTVTRQPQAGNPRPRVFRVPAEEAVVNRMGFPSSGVDALLKRMERWRGHPRTIRLGVNIGKNKETPLDKAELEYAELSRLVAPYADYICINVSSPNTPELRKLQEPERLAALLRACRSECQGKPLFVKLAPDIEPLELAPIVRVIMDEAIDGVVATNTTVSRVGCPAAEKIQGGLSGAPLFERSLSFVAHLYREIGGSIPIVGVGGIDSPTKAIRMLVSGATALQAYTGLVYRGPSMISTIHKGIVSWMQQHQVISISEIVGRTELLEGQQAQQKR